MSLHELLRTAGAFGVSILRGDQADVAAHFARGVPPLVLWDSVAVKDGDTGAPLLADALAWIECRLWARTTPATTRSSSARSSRSRRASPAPALVYREHGYHAV